jgi:hypothetical protein
MNGPTIKARIRNDLMNRIEAYFGKVEGHRADPDFKALCERIRGREVELYFIEGDAFEVNDELGFHLPDCCWERIGGS